MKEQWFLSPSREEKTINKDGMLSDEKDLICMEKDIAYAEAKERARRYLANGNIRPPGNRFFLHSLDGTYVICFHDL